jgi:ABC-2 type transport system permease protein
MRLFTAFRKEWLEALRQYRLLITAVVLVLFGLTSPLIAKVGPQILTTALPQGAEIAQLIKPATLTDAVTQYVKNMGQFEVILGVLLCMGMVAQEKDKGTAALMLVKPLSRGSFLGAKFLGMAAVFGISIIVAAIGAYYYTMLLFEPMNILYWLVLNLFLFIYALVIVAITLFCSTLTRSQAAAAGMAFTILVIGWIAGAIRGFGKYLPGELNTWGARLVLGDHTASWIALGTALGVIVIALLAAWLVFRKQEL